jgi:hypothetical protein
LINSIKVYQLAGPDEIPPPVANIRDASQNAQGIGGGRVNSNETSVGQASEVVVAEVLEVVAAEAITR